MSHHQPIDPITNELSERLIGAAIEVHRHMGPGLLESVYQRCLCHELKIREIPYETEVPLDLRYKDLVIGNGYRADLIVGKRMIVEVKSVGELHPVHRAQTLTYMSLFGVRLGLILNFNVPLMKNGILRLVR